MGLVIRVAAHGLVIQPAQAVTRHAQPGRQHQPPDLQPQLFLCSLIKDEIVVPGGKGLRREVRGRVEGEAGQMGRVEGQLFPGK